MGLGKIRIALRTSYQSRFPRIFVTFLSGEVGGGEVIVGLGYVPSPATATLLQPGSPLAAHMLQDVGPDVSPLAQTQPVGTEVKVRLGHGCGGSQFPGWGWGLH